MEKIRLDPSKKVIIPKLPKRKWVDDPEMKLCISLMPDFFNDQIIKNDSTLEDKVVVTDNYFLRTSKNCLLYTSPSPRDTDLSRMPSSA